MRWDRSQRNSGGSCQELLTAAGPTRALGPLPLQCPLSRSIPEVRMKFLEATADITTLTALHWPRGESHQLACSIIPRSLRSAQTIGDAQSHRDDEPRGASEFDSPNCHRGIHLSSSQRHRSSTNNDTITCAPTPVCSDLIERRFAMDLVNQYVQANFPHLLYVPSWRDFH